MWHAARLSAAIVLLISSQNSLAQPPPSADLAISKSAVGTLATSPPAPAGSVVPGTLLTYTSTATNNGPAAALNFTITDPLPLQTVFISAVASPGATLSAPAIGANGMVTGIWDAAGGTPGGLTPMSTVRTLTAVARICPEVACAMFDNTATASADPVSTAAMSTASSTTFPQADLAITKSGPAKVRRGETFTYTVTVSNAGPSNAPATQIIDNLPAGFVATHAVSTIPSVCDILPDGSLVVCTPTNPIGAANQCMTTFPTSYSVTITVEVPEDQLPGEYTNNAEVSFVGSCGADPNQPNNIATATTRVIAEPGVPVLSPLAAGALVLLLWALGSALMRRRRV